MGKISRYALMAAALSFLMIMMILMIQPQAYAVETAEDVIELKSGGRVFGKITGETHTSYFIKDLNGVEKKIDRSAVKSKRTPSMEEMESLKVLLAKKSKEPTTAWGKFWQKVGSFFSADLGSDKSKRTIGVDKEQYNAEVAAAKRARSDLDRRLAEEEARKKGEKAAPAASPLSSEFWGMNPDGSTSK